MYLYFFIALYQGYADCRNAMMLSIMMPLNSSRINLTKENSTFQATASQDTSISMVDIAVWDLEPLLEYWLVA